MPLDSRLRGNDEIADVMQFLMNCFNTTYKTAVNHSD